MIFNRGISTAISAQLANDLVIVIVGARQTGKTTLLRGLYATAKNESSPAYFINLERLEYLSLLNRSPENIFSIIPTPSKDQKTVVFIDEIQYLDNPTNFLKLLYDEHRDRLKLIVTGSSAFYVDLKFRDSLAGRKRLFQLNTLSLREFLVFRQREELLDALPESFSPENFSILAGLPLLLRDELVRLFSEYARFGGFPQVVLAPSEGEKLLILEDLVNSSVKKDILEARIRHPEPYFLLLKMLASQVGGLVNRNELAKVLGVSVQAVDNYLYVTQKSFHAAVVRPFHGNMRKELVKMPKIFFYDMGMRNYLVNDFRDFHLRSDKGAFLENLVFKQLSDHLSLDEINFWRTQDKTELDFVVKGCYGLEVKSSPETFLPSRYAGFRAKHPGSNVDVISYDIFKDMGGYRIWGAWGL